MEVLEKTLKTSYDLLNSGGFLLFITFHSLEDRMVKQFLKHYCVCYPLIRPSEEEIQQNSQCRSAKLRVAMKK